MGGGGGAGRVEVGCNCRYTSAGRGKLQTFFPSNGLTGNLR